MPSSRIHHLSTPDRLALWERWKAGQTFSEISLALGQGSGSVYSVVRRSGGIFPRARCQRSSSLRLIEREEISRGLAASLSYGTIAPGLGRAKSTICREVARNGGGVRYRAAEADARS